MRYNPHGYDFDKATKIPINITKNRDVEEKEGYHVQENITDSVPSFLLRTHKEYLQMKERKNVYKKECLVLRKKNEENKELKSKYELMINRKKLYKEKLQEQKEETARNLYILQQEKQKAEYEKEKNIIQNNLFNTSSELIFTIQDKLEKENERHNTFNQNDFTKIELSKEMYRHYNEIFSCIKMLGNIQKDYKEFLNNKKRHCSDMDSSDEETSSNETIFDEMDTEKESHPNKRLKRSHE